MINNFPSTNVYKKSNSKSEVVTQLLYGDTFKKLKINKSWIKIKNTEDQYQGFIKNKKYLEACKITHKVNSLYASMYSKPNTKSKIIKKITFSSKVQVTGKEKLFYQINNLWVKKKDLKKINYKNNEIFKNIKKFINVKYKWGGKSFDGIDCSGLVQVFFNFNNKFCPRDAKDQIKYFKKKIKLENIKKNDLIFWKGHVAVVLSKNYLIHAYGPYKRTVIMPIQKTIDRILKTTNLKVLGIRRVH